MTPHPEQGCISRGDAAPHAIPRRSRGLKAPCRSIILCRCEGVYSVSVPGASGVCPCRIISRNSASSSAIDSSIDASGRIRPNWWHARHRRCGEKYRVRQTSQTYRLLNSSCQRSRSVGICMAAVPQEALERPHCIGSGGGIHGKIPQRGADAPVGSSRTAGYMNCRRGRRHHV